MLPLIVLDHMRGALSVRIPGTDFTPYFAFIESLPPAMAGHRHHILPKKEFPEYTRTVENLVRVSPADHFRAHYWLAFCAPNYEPFQRVFFFMTKFKKYASQIGEAELPRYAEIYERGRAGQAKVASFYGRRNKEKHIGIFAPGSAAKAGRKGGPIGGRRAVESGQLAKLRTHEHQVSAAREGGRSAVKTGQLASLRTPEHQVMAARAAGRKAVESGRLAAFRTSEHQSAACRRRNEVHGNPQTYEGSVKGGGRALELGVGIFAPGEASKAGRLGGCKSAERRSFIKANHIRWHVNREKVSSACSQCTGNNS